MVHQEALASRTPSAEIKDKFAIIKRAVNVVKTSAVNQYSIVRKAVRGHRFQSMSEVIFHVEGVVGQGCGVGVCVKSDSQQH